VALLVDAEQLAELPLELRAGRHARASYARTSAGSSARGTARWGSVRSAVAMRAANHAATAGPCSRTIAAAEGSAQHAHQVDAIGASWGSRILRPALRPARGHAASARMNRSRHP
jgi:hypothetical protein